MKNRKIYHINYSRQVDTVIWEYTNLSDVDRTNLAQVNFDTSLDWEDKWDFYNMIVICQPKEMDKYRGILVNNLVFQHTRDISQLVLKNQYDFLKVKEHIRPSLHRIFDLFIDKVDGWIEENTDLDTVLDLINEKGIENLRISDKKFLENYAKR